MPPPAATIRRARPDEAARLTEIALAAKAHWGYPAAWLEAWRGGLTFTAAYIDAHPVYVAVGGDDRAVACYALEEAAGATQLEHVWVDPPAMGRGLGRALVEHAARTARDRGAAALDIDSDPHAEAFYLRMGAVRTGSVPADVCGEPRRLPRMRLALR